MNFLDIFSKKFQMSNFVKFGPVRAELFYAGRGTDGQADRDRRTDKAKLIVAFRNFAKSVQ